MANRGAEFPPIGLQFSTAFQGASFLTHQSNRVFSQTAFSGEGRWHREVAGPLLVQKEDPPWFEGRCHTMKKLLLVSVAFVGSCVLAALFVGALLALAVALARYLRTRKGHRLLRNRREPPYHAELQTVVEALAEAEEIERESTLDYCKLKSDPPEKEA